MHPKNAVCHPALPLQQGMLFNGLRQPDAGIDVVQCVIDWPGLDVAAYRAAWQNAVARHAILRTGFRLAGDAPVQEVWQDAELEFTERDEPLAEFLAADRRRGFTFDAPPLVRLTVLTHEVPVVVLTLHHAVLDGRSLAMLMSEVDSEYEGRPDFPARAEYHTFAEWLTERDAEPDLGWWTEHLAGVTGPTPLPFGRDAGVGAGGPAQVVEFGLTDKETAALGAVADRAGVTVNTLLLAAWALVLGAHAGTDDVVFGTTRSARHGSVPGADGIVGVLLASSPVRIRLDKSLPVDDWLRSVRAETVASRDHQLAPLADIQCRAGVPDLLSSLVLYERQDLHTLLRKENPAWNRRDVRFHRQVSYPVTVYAFAEPTLRVILIHDRFTPAEAAMLAGHLRTVLVQLGEPPATVGDLTVLTAAEHPGAAGELGPAATVPELFAVQVKQRPDADAVFDGDRWWSYRELAQRADRIAGALLARGVRVEEPVAVAVPRSAHMIAAFLGVLKAGAAYLPVDPDNPAARNATVLADAAVRFVLADGGEWPAEVVPVADLPAVPPVPCPALPDTVAYLNYTSGSTGKPKGVAVPHRGVVRLVSEPNFATVGPGQTFLHAAAPSFDATTFEVWGALLTGGRVVPAPPGPLDASELTALVKQHDVTVLWLTAGLFHQLVEHDVRALSDVDQLFAGGDVLAPDAVRAALAARGGRPVTNGYGPTENTTFTTCHVMRGPGDLGATTPIGTPVQHTTVYVLDEAMRPAPAGELYTGGAGLARGYLDRPALTAAKFVPNPFGPPGSRLYRTGDRVRRRPDGTLEFAGRVDHQVKIRGYLVEPGETESVLRAHPQVGDAAVVVHGSGDARGLVAYLAPGADRLDLADVRAHVAAALPEYLRPVTYQVLPRLPLTDGGKIDRKALPAPVAEPARTHEPLTTEAQHRMAKVWQGLLNVGEVGANDSFFDLGGNSLLAMRLTFRLRDTFGVEVPIREVYRAATLAELVEVVATAKAPTRGIVRRDRNAYRAASPVPAHLVAGPDPNWALWRWIELRGTGFGIAPLLDLAAPECAAAANRVLACEREFQRHRGAVLDGIKEALTIAPADIKPALRKGSKLICKGRFAELGPDIVARPHARELLAAAEDLAVAHREYADAFAAATAHAATGLRDVARDTKFREAVAWQNPRALHTAVDSLARTETPKHNSQFRQWTALVHSYLQRYSAKNDTIGFFGPVGWARVADAEQGIGVTPGRGLLAKRTVFLESWAVQELAEALSTPDALPWAVPRRMPFVVVTGSTLHVPLGSPIELTPDEAAVLHAVDGRRTARELAGALPDVDVYAVLEKLRDARRIAWRFEVAATTLVPQDELRAQLDRIEDEKVRARSLSAVDELEAARRAVAAAAGDPDRLTAALTDLKERFTRHTGAAAVRRPGQFYAGRTLVYEECRRDLDVRVGPDVLATLQPPLTLLLESARWFTSAGAALYRRALRDMFRAHSTGEPLRLPDFWLWANDIIFRLDKRVIDRLTAALQDRWARILRLEPGSSRVTLRAEALRDQVATSFAAPRPGWRSAVQHSPDVMIAAKDAAAIRAGDFQWVLGELHAGVNTVRSALFVSQHPNAADLHAAMAADLAGPRIVVAPTREEGGIWQRLADALVAPTDVRVVSAHDACGPDVVGAILLADLLVSEVDGKLVAHDRSGGSRMDLVELLNEQLMGQLVQQFRLLPVAPHQPRVTIDKLVVSRENWRLPTADLAFAFAADEQARFLRAQEWRQRTGIPRFVFVKSPVELKPFYVDLASLPSVEHFAHAIRALDREEPGATLSVGEMLPGPDELWLTDAEGARYTAEFRFVAVDRRGPEGGQS